MVSHCIQRICDWSKTDIWFNNHKRHPITHLNTVYPKKYAHGFCFVVVIHWLIFPYPSDLLHWHCGNLTIAPVPAKQPWWIWINISCEFIMNDCVTTTKQSTTKPCANFLGYTVHEVWGLFLWGFWRKLLHYNRTPLNVVIFYMLCNSLFSLPLHLTTQWSGNFSGKVTHGSVFYGGNAT